MLKFVEKYLVFLNSSYFMLVGVTHLMVNYCDTRSPFWGIYIILFYLLEIVYFVLSLIMITRTYKDTRVLIPISIVTYQILSYVIKIYMISVVR